MDIRRVKRQTSDAGDDFMGLLDQAQDMFNNMGGTDAMGDAVNNAKNLLDQAQDMFNNVGGTDAMEDAANIAKNILDQAKVMAGDVLENMPRDLLEMATSLYRMSQTPSFQKMLQRVLNADTWEEAKSSFNKLVADADFVRASQELMEAHGNVPDDPAFRAALENMVLEHLSSTKSGAKGIGAHLTPLLVVHVARMLM